MIEEVLQSLVGKRENIFLQPAAKHKKGEILTWASYNTHDYCIQKANNSLAYNKDRLHLELIDNT